MIILLILLFGLRPIIYCVALGLVLLVSLFHSLISTAGISKLWTLNSRQAISMKSVQNAEIHA